MISLDAKFKKGGKLYSFLIDCGRRCLAALNKIQQNEIERIRGIVLISSSTVYTCEIDIDSSSEPSGIKLLEIYILEVIYAFLLESDSRPLYDKLF